MKVSLTNFLVGILLIGIGFWVGTQPNPVFGLLGFLCFFLIGMTLIIEGYKKIKSKNNDPKPPLAGNSD